MPSFYQTVLSAIEMMQSVKNKQDDKQQNRRNALEDSSNDENEIYISATGAGEVKNWLKKYKLSI